MRHRYPIPASTVRTETVVKRSRFITTLGYADTVEAAKRFIQTIRQEMPDATHHVYAFRVGYGSSIIEGLSDDGEPAGTSGKPVMSVLRGADIGDVVMVVTRYFGGVKLGTGGLVRAYSGAAKMALEHGQITEKVSTVALKITLSYQTYSQFNRILPEYQAHIVAESFTDEVTLMITIPEDQLNAFSERMHEYHAARITSNTSTS